MKCLRHILFGDVLIQLLCHFLSWSCLFILIYRSSLYVLNIKCDANIYFQFVVYLLILFIVSFNEYGSEF